METEAQGNLRHLPKVHNAQWIQEGFWEKGCWGSLRPVLFLVFSLQGEGLELTFKEILMRRLGVVCSVVPAMPLLSVPRTQTLWGLLRGVTSLPAVVLGRGQI